MDATARRRSAQAANVNVGICLTALVVIAGLGAVAAVFGSSAASARADMRSMLRVHLATDCPATARVAYDASTTGIDHMHGAVGTPHARLVATAPPLGTCRAAELGSRPNARRVSNALFAQERGADASPLSALAWSFGQLIDHTVALSRTRAASSACPALRISTDGDAHFGARGPIEMQPTAFEYNALARDHRVPAGISAFIDASSVYGSSAARAYHLRAFVGGELRVAHADRLHVGAETLPNNTASLENVGGATNTRMFLAGDVRSSEHALLAAWHTLWVREHNYQARRLRATLATDECVFQAARAVVAAEMQRATFDEFVPALLGAPLAAYRGYNASVDPRVSLEFAGAAYRMGHSMVNERLERRRPSDGAPLEALELRRIFKHPDALLLNGVDELVAGALGQRAEAIDARVVDALRQHLFEDEGHPLDLVAMNIERGRELALTPFAALRSYVAEHVATEMPAGVRWRYAADAAVIADVYASSDVDAYVGLLAEAPARPGAPMGATLEAIVRDQFTRLRDGDPRYYRALGDRTLARYVDSREGSLRAILERTTTIAPALLRERIFVLE